MFNVGLSELIIIFFVAFVIVGPRDLPKVIKTAVRGIKYLRRMVQELKAESGWDDMIKEIDQVKDTAAAPIQAAEKEIAGIGDAITGSAED